LGFGDLDDDPRDRDVRGVDRIAKAKRLGISSGARRLPMDDIDRGVTHFVLKHSGPVSFQHQICRLWLLLKHIYGMEIFVVLFFFLE
jgi:hypothetical protein